MLATRSGAERKRILRKCFEDPIYFINGFCVTHKPKPRPKDLPMILYPRQVEYVRLLASNLGRADMHCEKSREVGVSWVACQELLRWWLFEARVKFLLASWKERYVWHPGDMDALFQKLQFTVDHLPPWMRPRYVMRKLRFANANNGALFSGEATVENMGKAGRQTAILLDEAAHMRDLAAILEGTADTTDCRIMQSTPSFATHEFSLQRNKCAVRFRFWWPDHPVKAQGLYGEGLKQKPASGWWSDGLEELRDKIRSPWFDHRCSRARNAGEVAREVNIDDSGTGYRFFEEQLLRDKVEWHCQPPMHEGELIDGAFVELVGLGPLKLWFHPPVTDGKPPQDRRYVCGCDIAAGTKDESGRGQSNSCAVFYDGKTGETVAEYTVHGVSPDDFAKAVVPVCRWFSTSEPVFLGWEDNGPGELFAKVVMEDEGYSSVYYRQQEAKVGKPQTAQPGWWSTAATKYILFCEYLQALKDGHITERNIEAVREMRCYQTGPRSVYHIDAETTSDPTQAKENHGDRVIARAVGWRCLREIGYRGPFGLPDAQVTDYDAGDAPVGSPAWCREHPLDAHREMDLARY